MTGRIDVNLRVPVVPSPCGTKNRHPPAEVWLPGCVPDGWGDHNKPGDMLIGPEVLFLIVPGVLGLLALYWIIRLGVRDGMNDAHRRRRTEELRPIVDDRDRSAARSAIGQPSGPSFGFRWPCLLRLPWRTVEPRWERVCV